MVNIIITEEEYNRVSAALTNFEQGERVFPTDEETEMYSVLQMIKDKYENSGTNNEDLEKLLSTVKNMTFVIHENTKIIMSMLGG